MLLSVSITKSHAETSFQEENTGYIIGPIAQGNILPLGKRMLDLASDPMASRDFNLIINSPGGEVATGSVFVAMMEEAKASGLNVRCFVPGMAASMAFTIFMHCSERHALETSGLLWHRVRVLIGGLGGEAMTSPLLQSIAEQLQAADETVISDVLKYVGVSNEVMFKHLEAETLHNAVNLKKLAPSFLTVHKAVPGLLSSTLEYMRQSAEQAMKRLPQLPKQPNTTYTIVHIYNEVK